MNGESGRWRYGLVAVIVAVIVILVAFVFASLRYDAADDVSTALAAVTGTLGTLLGAYLGVQTGAAGKESTEAARKQGPCSRGPRLVSETVLDCARPRAGRGNICEVHLTSLSPNENAMSYLVNSLAVFEQPPRS